MADTTSIELSVGLGPLRFGDSPEQVMSYLGPPESVERDRQGVETWSYRRRLALAVEFCNDGAGAPRLAGFTTEDADSRLLGLQIVDVRLADLVRLLERAGIGKRFEHEWGDGYRFVSFDGGLDVVSICGTVTEASWRSQMA